MAITHDFISAVADGADTTLVQPSDWNADHTIENATITAAMLASGVSGLGYTVPLSFTIQGTPGDGGTYFAGLPANFGFSTSSDTWAEGHARVPVAGTITAVSFSVKVVSTLASGESVTTVIRVNDTTDIASTEEARFDVAFETWSVTGLSTAVAAGDTIALKMVMPTFGTNPTNSTAAALVYIS